MRSRQRVLRQKGVEHVDIGDERIDTTNLISAKHVDISKMFVENLASVFTSVMQVQRDVPHRRHHMEFAGKEPNVG